MNVDINKGSLINKNNQFNGNEFCFNKDNSNDKKRQVTSEQKSKDSSFSYFSSLTNWAGSFFSNNEESSKSIFDIYFESPNNNNIKYDSSKSVIENLDNFTQQNQQTRDFIIQVISDENAHLDAIAKALELLESDNSLFNKTSQKDYFTTLTSRLKDKETILKSGEYYFYESLKHAFEDGNTGWYNEHISYNSLFKNALNSYLETFLKEENKAELLKQSGLSQEQSTHIENILNQYEDNIDGHKLLKYALLSSEEITYSEESGIFKRLWDFACKNKGKIATSIFLSMPQIVNTTEGSMPTSENTFSFGRQAVPKNQNPLSNRNTYPLETKKLFLPPPKCPYFRQLGSNYEYMHSMKIDYYPNHWQSDLYNAFREKNLKNAESLLRTNKIMIQDDFNNPILNQAVQVNSTSWVIGSLIERNAFMSEEMGSTLLGDAIKDKLWYEAAILVEHGAKEDLDNSLLTQALESKAEDHEIAQIIDGKAYLGKDAGINLMQQAIKNKQWPIVASLLKRGVKISTNVSIIKLAQSSGANAYDIAGLLGAGAKEGSDDLILKKAIKRGINDHEVKALIDAGASLGSDNGKSFLEGAISKKQWFSIAVLLKAGAKEDPNNLILKQAIESGTAIYDIKPLIDAGANLGSDSGKGLIDLAISKKQWKIVELFLKAGATEDPNNLILKQAIESEISIYDIKSLIDTGASLGSDSGKGLLEFAISKKQWGVVELFLKAGAQEDESSSIVEKAISLNIKDKELKNIIQSGAKLGSDNNKNKLFTDFVKRAYWRSSFAILAQDPSLINRVKDLDLAQLESLILHSSGGVSVLKEITKIDERVLKHVNLKKAYTRALNEISYQTLSTIKNAGDAEKLIQSGAVNIDIVTSKAPYGSIAQLYYSKDGPWRELALKYSEESLIRGLQILHSKGDLKQIRPKGKEHVTTIGIVHTNPYSGSFTDNGYRLARRIMNRIDNLEYVIITPDLLTKEVMAQLDGVYLSGGGDNYPQSEFTLNGYPEIKRSSLENHYQNALKLADEEKVPVVGICLGNQQIGLYNGASINKVGFHSSTTVFETNSPTNFFMLTKQQKRKALNDCKITQIKIERVISAHSFAVINPGNKGLKISGKSLTGTSEATYRDLDFFGTQYHPETVSAQAIHYKNKPENNRPLQLRYMYEVTRQFQRRNRFLKTARKVEKAEHKMQAISLSKKYKTLADQALLKRLEHCTTKKDPKSQSDWKNLNVKEFSWEAFDEAYLVKLEEEMTILQKNRAKN